MVKMQSTVPLLIGGALTQEFEVSEHEAKELQRVLGDVVSVVKDEAKTEKKK